MFNTTTSGTTATINGYVDNTTPTGTTLTSTGTYFNNLTIGSNMNRVQNVKVAIFQVERSKQTNEVTSSKFLQEMWVELKPNTSLELVVAKQLKDFDPECTVIRTIQTMAW
jgi:hypothetical protein